MNVRMAIVIAGLSAVTIWAAAFVQCGKGPAPKEEPRCTTELVADELNGMKRVEKCKD